MMNLLKLSFLFIVIFLLGSCQKELEDVNETIQESEKILYEGKFVGTSRYNTTGDIKIVLINEKVKLQFINFKTDAGPDLKIYASSDTKASSFTVLSNEVKNGTYTIDLENIDFIKAQPNILIWCKQFSVLFGNAALTKK